MFGMIGQHRKKRSLHGIMSSWACTSAVQCSVVGGHDDNRNSRNTGTVIIQCQGETFQRDQRTELCSKRKIDRHPITMVRQFFKFTSPASPGIILLHSCTPCSHPSLIIRSEWQWTPDGMDRNRITNRVCRPDEDLVMIPSRSSASSEQMANRGAV